jgi:hypothetical protein
MEKVNALYLGKLTPAPTREVVLTRARELGVGAAMDLISPALSTKVLRLGSGSAAKSVSTQRRNTFHAPLTRFVHPMLKIRHRRQPRDLLRSRIALRFRDLREALAGGWDSTWRCHLRLAHKLKSLYC